MGGRIGVESTPGAGTTFWFTYMPAVIVGALQPVSARPPAARPACWLGGLHLLVAEDNEMNQFVTRETLRQVGCSCDIVADGQAAVQAIWSRHYDAVLMDSQMPGMDGLEATQRIREQEAVARGRRRMPIIALTAEAIAGDREKCLAAGMDGYVSKPIDPQALFNAITSLVTAARPTLAVSA
jgi:CheY-like chemotaxis protein